GAWTCSLYPIEISMVPTATRSVVPAHHGCQPTGPQGLQAVVAKGFYSSPAKRRRRRRLRPCRWSAHASSTSSPRVLIHRPTRAAAAEEDVVSWSWDCTPWIHVVIDYRKAWD